MCDELNKFDAVFACPDPESTTSEKKRITEEIFEHIVCTIFTSTII